MEGALAPSPKRARREQNEGGGSNGETRERPQEVRSADPQPWATSASSTTTAVDTSAPKMGAVGGGGERGAAQVKEVQGGLEGQLRASVLEVSQDVWELGAKIVKRMEDLGAL